MPADAARAALSSEWFDRLARVGYISKGAVFGIIGFLAGKTALRRPGGEDDADAFGALETVAEQPIGMLPLGILVLGLAAYGCWRLLQALGDAEGLGKDPKALTRRATFLAIGLTYLTFAAYSFALLLGWGGTGNEDGVRDASLMLMEFPAGEWVVGLGGLAVMGYGLMEVHAALTGRFKREFRGADLNRGERWVARWVGAYGHAARGGVFMAAGFFSVRAAVTFDPEEARGLAETFREVATQPYGPLILGLAALGFVAYGIHFVMLGFHRHIPNEDVFAGFG
jgi:hypothetical protein